MIAFPNAKINLGLYVTGKRPDGFHNIESLFLPVDIKDAIEIIPAETSRLFIHGDVIPGDPKDNLCWKAYELLREEYDLPNVHIHLLKKIPSGAGLGGGSADAAFTLKTLNEKFLLKLTIPQLETYAAKLGSDCIFFVRNKTAFVSGRGEKIESCKLNLSRYKLVIIYPEVHMGTAEAYKLVKHGTPPTQLNELTKEIFLEDPYILTNAFEHSFFQVHPQLTFVKEKLIKEGALYASLTGSGSAFYGIFDPRIKDVESLKDFATKNQFRSFITTIL